MHRTAPRCSEGFPVGMVVTALAVVSLLAVSQAGALDLKADSFVPDASAWMETTYTTIKANNLFSYLGVVAQLVLLIFFIKNGIDAWTNRSGAMFLRSIFVSVVASVLIQDAMKGGTATNTIYRAPIEAWQSVYTLSTKSLQKGIKDGIEKDTIALANAMQSFVTNSMMGLGTMSNLSGDSAYQAAIMNTGKGKPGAAEDEGYTAVKGVWDKQEAFYADQRKDIENMSYAYQIGYLILMGFFMAFAGVVYFSGMSIILAMFAFPLALAFWAGGNSKAIKMIFGTCLVGIATVAILPSVMLIVTKLALQQPTVLLTQSIDKENKTANAAAQKYSANMLACFEKASKVPKIASAIPGLQVIKPMTRTTCMLETNAPLVFGEIGRVLVRVIMGLAMMVISLMIGVAIGAALIRLVPNYLNPLFEGGATGSDNTSVGSAGRTAMQAASVGGAALSVAAAPLAAGMQMVQGGDKRMGEAAGNANQAVGSMIQGAKDNKAEAAATAGNGSGGTTGGPGGATTPSSAGGGTGSASSASSSTGGGVSGVPIPAAQTMPSGGNNVAPASGAASAPPGAAGQASPQGSATATEAPAAEAGGTEGQPTATGGTEGQPTAAAGAESGQAAPALGAGSSQAQDTAQGPEQSASGGALGQDNGAATMPGASAGADPVPAGAGNAQPGLAGNQDASPQPSDQNQGQQAAAFGAAAAVGAAGAATAARHRTSDVNAAGAASLPPTREQRAARQDARAEQASRKEAKARADRMSGKTKAPTATAMLGSGARSLGGKAVSATGRGMASGARSLGMKAAGVVAANRYNTSEAAKKKADPSYEAQKITSAQAQANMERNGVTSRPKDGVAVVRATLAHNRSETQQAQKEPGYVPNKVTTAQVRETLAANGRLPSQQAGNEYRAVETAKQHRASEQAQMQADPNHQPTSMTLSEADAQNRASYNTVQHDNNQAERTPAQDNSGKANGGSEFPITDASPAPTQASAGRRLDRGNREPTQSGFDRAAQPAPPPRSANESRTAEPQFSKNEEPQSAQSGQKRGKASPPPLTSADKEAIDQERLKRVAQQGKDSGSYISKSVVERELRENGSLPSYAEANSRMVNERAAARGQTEADAHAQLKNERKLSEQVYKPNEAVYFPDAHSEAHADALRQVHNQNQRRQQQLDPAYRPNYVSRDQQYKAINQEERRAAEQQTQNERQMAEHDAEQLQAPTAIAQDDQTPEPTPTAEQSGRENQTARRPERSNRLKK